MKWKWRNDRRSERNSCNWVKKPEKNSGLNGVWTRDLAITRAILDQLSYEATDVVNKNMFPMPSFFFQPLTYDCVKTETLFLSNNKSHGLYSSPTKLLKCSIDIIAPVLSEVFNISISLGRYPTTLKLSKIVPVFRSNDESDPNNYRPISLLSNFNRIFERLV